MDRSKPRFTYAVIFPMAVLLGVFALGGVPGDTQGIAQELSLDRDEICPLRGDEEAIAEVHNGRFCTYSAGPSATCQQPIEEQLIALDARMPDDRFELIDYGQTHLGNTIWAVRIGNLNNATPEHPRPQIVLVGAQHAREWISAQVMMELIHHFAEGAGSGLEMLDEAVITIMPVNNPDGYNYSFTDARLWRTNRWECPNGNIGVDPNRNYPMTFTEPGNDPDCESGIYRGPAPGSEPETTAGRNLIASTDADGAYRTVFVFNIHSFGNLVLLPDGLSAGFDMCSTNTNCSTADLGALHVLGGTRAYPKFVGERGLPFRNGQTYRSLYAASGDLTADAMFGDLPNDAPNPMSITLEIGDSQCGFQSEFYSEAQYQLVLKQQIEYAEYLLENAPELMSGQFYDSQVGVMTLPHIHRRQIEMEHPTLRVGARNSESRITGTALNGDRAEFMPDDVMPGVAYDMWRWRPSIDPFEFPRRIEICPGQLFYCRDLVIGGTMPSVSDTLDLCSPNSMTASAGWEFVGRRGAYLNPGLQCYWKPAFDPSAPTARTLEMEVSLSQLEESTLTFSFLHGNNEVSIVAQATTGDFSGCGYKTGECRILFNTQWRGSISWVPFNDDFIPDSGFRTEIIDLSDFDGEERVKIRFQVLHAPLDMGIFDPVVTGWAAD